MATRKIIAVEYVRRLVVDVEYKPRHDVVRLVAEPRLNTKLEYRPRIDVAVEAEGF
jgi:hypothetical protein